MQKADNHNLLKTLQDVNTWPEETLFINVGVLFVKLKAK